MINRCFAFVPGIKHLVVLRSAVGSVLVLNKYGIKKRIGR